ncbi:unnamed protein product [Sphagnum troendelagicum]
MGPNGVVICVNFQVIGIGVLASSSAAVNIRNTGIPGTYGSMDMHYTGVVRICTSADITALFKGMQVVADGIFLCTHTDGHRTGECYVELFQSTKGEMTTALQQRIYGMLLGVGGFSQFGSPNQVASGAFGMTGLLAPQTPHTSWVDIQNAAADAVNFYQCQAAGLIGAHASLPSISSFDPSLSTNKVRGHPPHRTLVQIFLQL